MNFKKYQKYLIGIAAIFLTTTGIANAQAFEWAVGGLLQVVGFVAATLLYMVGYVASLGVTVGGTLTNWALNLNSQILNDNLVQTGWVVSRDIANLGFVFAIILIAFATILQMQSYSMKKILWKLIAAALIVNFSLVIAGVFIDFSGVLTDFFLSRATNGNLSNSGETLVNAIGVHRVFQQNESESTIRDKVSNLSTDFNNFVNFTASLAFGVFFTIATATALFSFAAMFFIRYLSLITLLILAPLAWLMWVWPDTEGQFKKWWSEFFKWIWFGPAASFFFYLAISLALTFNKGGANFIQGETLGAIKNIDNAGLLIQNLGKLITQMVSVIGLMYYGLTVSNSMGIAGSNFGFAVAGRVKGMITGAAAGAGGWIGRGALQRTLSAGVDAKGQSSVQRLANTLIGVPGLRGAGIALHGAAASAMARGTPDDVKSYQKRISGLGNDEIIKLANSTSNNVERAAIANIVAQRKISLSSNPQENNSKMTQLMQAAKATGTEKEILEARPDLAMTIGKSIGSVTQKIKVKDTAAKISEAALESSEVVLTLGIQNLENIAKEGADSQKEAIIKALQAAEKYIGALTDEKERTLMEAKFKERSAFVRNNISFQPHLSGVQLPGEAPASALNDVPGIRLNPPPKNS